MARKRKRYDVADHNEEFITLRQPGIHLVPHDALLYRATIASVTVKRAIITVTTSDGRRFEVYAGVRAEQRALVAAAFNL